MEIRRFFASENAFDGRGFSIEGEEAVHALKVLRQKKGFKVVICTGDGFDYHCEITETGDGYFRAELTEKVFNDRETETEITLFAALSKPDKFEIVVQKAVELGVSRIVPILTRYSEKYEINAPRLERIATDAAKQCKRAVKPEICAPEEFSEAIAEALRADKSIMAYELERTLSVADVSFLPAKSVALIVGAEGGFSEDEARDAAFAGVKTVSLGKRILRAETAAITLLSVALYALGEMK